VRDYESVRVVEVTLESGLQIRELALSDQLLGEDPLAQVLCEIQQDATTTMARRVDVNERVYPDVNEAGVAKEAW